MNKKLLESCETLEQCVNVILRENMIINESVGFYDYKGGRSKTNGLYLKINKKKINSGFDTLIHGLIYGYLNSIEYRLEGNINEFTNDSIWDAIVMVQEVLLNWVHGHYKIIYPTTVEELIDIVFNEYKAQNVCNFLFGVVKRLAKNLLFCNSKYENNNYTVNPRKFSFKEIKDGKQIWNYCYVQLNSIDVRNDNDDNIFGNDLRNNILDDFYYKNDMLQNDLFEKEDNVEGKLEAILQLFSKEKQDRIRAVFNNEETTIGYKEAIDCSSRMSIKRQEKKGVSFYNLKFDENGYIAYAGDFIDFANKLMQSQDLCEKFEMIKRALNRDDSVGNTLMDIILGLDYEIYHTFFQHLKDSKYVKYYVKSDNFRLILDMILEEYKSQQNRFRQIYVYNETQRREKINKLKSELLKFEKDNCINTTDISRVYRKYIQEFDLESYNSYNKLNTIERKISSIRNIGFELEAMSKQKYTIKEVI